MNDEQIERIITYVKSFNKTIDDEDLLKYSVMSAISRVLLYLNHDALDQKFEMIVADVVNAVFMRYYNNQNSTEIEQAISSVSDNGQSISFKNEVMNYFNTADDNELLGGTAKLLARYRRARLANTGSDEEDDSGTIL